MPWFDLSQLEFSRAGRATTALAVVSRMLIALARKVLCDDVSLILTMGESSHANGPPGANQLNSLA